jgi:peptide/nickel transport system substrate-binding protein
VSPAISFYALPEDELAELQKYNPELAKDYLRKAGYDEEENRLQLDLLSIAGFQDFTDIAQLVQANLREIGIDIEIRIQEVGVWVESRVNLGDYDLSVNDGGSGIPPNFTYYRSDQTEQEWTGGKWPELDALIDAANVAPDEEERRELVLDIQRMLIERVRELYLFATPIFEVWSKDLVGYEPWPTGTNLRVFDREQVYYAG